MIYYLEIFVRAGKWTWRVRAPNGRILCSSTRQTYSRRTDALTAAKNFLKAARDGRVETRKV